jgi:hypothetical protein
MHVLKKVNNVLLTVSLISKSVLVVSLFFSDNCVADKDTIE